jgi:hypothetical protein
MKIQEKGKNLRLVEEQEGAFNDLPLVEGQSIAIHRSIHHRKKYFVNSKNIF